MIAGGENLRQIYLYFFRVVSIGQRQRGKADHRVHRRADVVRHAGEEGALCFICLLGQMEGLFRQMPCLFQGGVVFTKLLIELFKLPVLSLCFLLRLIDDQGDREQRKQHNEHHCQQGGFADLLHTGKSCPHDQGLVYGNYDVPIRVENPGKADDFIVSRIPHNMNCVTLSRKHIFPEGIAVLYNIVVKKCCVLEGAEEQIPVFRIREVVRMEQGCALAVNDADLPVSPKGLHFQKLQIGIQFVVHKQILHLLCAHRKRLNPFSKHQEIRILILPQKKDFFFTLHQRQKVLRNLLQAPLAGSVQGTSIIRKQQYVIGVG